MNSISCKKLLATLISYKTINPPGNELDLCIELETILSSIGFNVEIQDLGNNRGNIIATIGSSTPEKSLMLTGHLDVVGVDNGWESPPFILTEKDKKLFGRGTCDMKGAIATMITSSQKFLKQHSLTKNQLILAFVSDEEVTGKGSKALLKSGIKADFAVIGEPTMMNICIGHRGVDRYRITITGKSGHASNPINKNNPIYFAAKILTAIEQLQEKLSEKKHSLLPPPSIAATIIHSGIQGNTIPEQCEIIVDRRTIPGENKDFVHQEINSIVDKIHQDYRSCSVKYSQIAWIPSTIPKDNFNLQNIAYDVISSLNIESSITDFPAGCDQYVFIANDIDTILVGPGNIKQAHTTNEYIEISQLNMAEKFYFTLMKSILIDN